MPSRDSPPTASPHSPPHSLGPDASAPPSTCPEDPSMRVSNVAAARRHFFGGPGSQTVDESLDLGVPILRALGDHAEVRRRRVLTRAMRVTS